MRPPSADERWVNTAHVDCRWLINWFFSRFQEVVQNVFHKCFQVYFGKGPTRHSHALNFLLHPPVILFLFCSFLTMQINDCIKSRVWHCLLVYAWRRISLKISTAIGLWHSVTHGDGMFKLSWVNSVRSQTMNSTFFPPSTFFLPIYSVCWQLIFVIW